ncbi:hypothetical protein BU14_0087s0057 [Porphyra umbilicalis]|uniref:Pyroglutamyl-peptidase I n=1 Tax=Porphyra umbilicalis TaxID=2786 RepID=A0A1X6PE76_PORUM|nr:hypothetical protein BU14_0087s0057 [Porphyra umbilicalis]|eukprot:OSX79110.1 hypothetical protein BU14_0087s0057 [Porphyra umbilicalis]
MPDNPSGRLVNALPDALARMPVAAAAALAPSSVAPSTGAPPPAVVLASHQVLTVSTVAVDAALTDLYVSISGDAGRFVCNWTYYRSLAHVADLERSPAAASVAGEGVAGCEQAGTTAASVGTATVGVGSGGAVTAGGGSDGVGAPAPIETGVAAAAHPPPPAAAHAAPPLTALFVHVPAVRSGADHGWYADFAAALLHALAATDWR